MWVRVFCSRCGSTRRFSSKSAKVAAMNIVRDGWGSCGTSIYCPKCTKTWAERNSIPMSDHLNTLAEIMEITIKHLAVDGE